MSKSIAKFIRSQIPQFVNESDSMFPYFMEAYYEWMSKSDNPTGLIYELDGVANVDAKYDKFVDEFIYEYIDIIPEDIAADKTLLIKKIIEIYKAKGTNKSIRLLFKILYGIDIDIRDPSEFLFKPSAARYIKPKAIRFTLISGSITDTTDIAFTLKKGNDELSYKFDFITKVNDTLWEGQFQTNNSVNLADGYTIISQTFTGTPVKTINKKTIVSRGRGFKVGDVFDIQSSGGTGTKIKVTRTDGDKLRSFDIIRFGTGYPTNFTYTLYSNTSDSVTENRNLSITNDGITSEFTSNDNVNKLVDQYQISRFTYFQSLDYLEDNTYVGELLVAGQTEVTGSQANQNIEAASIFFELGYVFEYVGYYVTNEGVPSDVSVLQDGEYWQQFSYVIKSAKQYDEYQDIVKKLVHPAGLRMFGEYSIDKTLEISIDMKTYLDTFKSILIDTFDIDDGIQRIDFIKTIDYFDGIAANSSLDTIGFGIGGDIATYSPEKFKVLDLIEKTLEKGLITDNQNLSDVKTLQVTKNIQESISLLEQINFTLQTYIEDSSIIYDQIPEKTITKNIMVPAKYEIFVDNTMDAILVDSIDTLGSDSDTITTFGGANDLAINTNDSLVGVDEIEEEQESFTIENFGGLILNPYYSVIDLESTTTPYWQFGYTVNERIIS